MLLRRRHFTMGCAGSGVFCGTLGDGRLTPHPTCYEGLSKVSCCFLVFLLRECSTASGSPRFVVSC
jgi:hypothetical protein